MTEINYEKYCTLTTTYETLQGDAETGYFPISYTRAYLSAFSDDPAYIDNLIEKLNNGLIVVISQKYDGKMYTEWLRFTNDQPGYRVDGVETISDLDELLMADDDIFTPQDYAHMRQDYERRLGANNGLHALDDDDIIDED